jgi:HJR/Mrr/RecB family endonuclease
MGDYKRGLCWYSRALKDDPKNISLLIKKGNTLVNIHRNESAYKSYVEAFIYANAIDILDGYVDRYPSCLDHEIDLLKNLLASNYNIHITLGGLKVFLDKLVKERTRSKQRKEWNHFKNILETKPFATLDDIFYLYLKTFGEKFYVHAMRFFCYLFERPDIAISKRVFFDNLLKQMDKIKFENFEHFLRTGRKQPFLERMTADEFVDFMVDFFQNRGYTVRKNPVSYDFGCDLLLYKFGDSTAVQLKARKQTVGISAVEEVHAGRGYYNTRGAMVISLGGFSSSAVKMANRLSVLLWDKKKLLEQMNKPWI